MWTEQAAGTSPKDVLLPPTSIVNGLPSNWSQLSNWKGCLWRKQNQPTKMIFPFSQASEAIIILGGHCNSCIWLWKGSGFGQKQELLPNLKRGRRTEEPTERASALKLSVEHQPIIKWNNRGMNFMSHSLDTKLGESLISKSDHWKRREVTKQDVTQLFQQLVAESTLSPSLCSSIVRPR